MVVTKLGGDNPLLPLPRDSGADQLLGEMVEAVTFCRINKVYAQLPGAGQNVIDLRLFEVFTPYPGKLPGAYAYGGNRQFSFTESAVHHCHF
jgi:hypothetical protein